MNESWNSEISGLEANGVVGDGQLTCLVQGVVCRMGKISMFGCGVSLE